jgi:hypothetical protein
LKKPACDTVLQSAQGGASSELAHLRSMVAHLQVRLLRLAALALLLRSRVGTSASS